MEEMENPRSGLAVKLIGILCVCALCFYAGRATAPAPVQDPAQDPAPVVQTAPPETAPESDEIVLTEETKQLLNAVIIGQSILDQGPCSRQDFCNALAAEGIPEKVIRYVADNGGINWDAQEAALAAAETTPPETQPAATQPAVTAGQRNALRAAQSYLSHSAFSYSGLIHQLEFEGYTNEEATYGADNCGADWMEQAAKCAASYLKHSAFSRSGLIHQLEFEGFTNEQAVYGVEQNGL